MVKAASKRKRKKTIRATVTTAQKARPAHNRTFLLLQSWQPSKVALLAENT